MINTPDPSRIQVFNVRQEILPYIQLGPVYPAPDAIDISARAGYVSVSFQDRSGQLLQETGVGYAQVYENTTDDDGLT